MEDNEKHIRDIEDTMGRSNKVQLESQKEWKEKVKQRQYQMKQYLKHIKTDKIYLDDKTGPLCTGAKSNLGD